MTGGDKQFLGGGTKAFVSSNLRVKIKKQALIAELTKSPFLRTISRVKTKKKVFTAESTTNRYLLTNSKVMMSILRVSGLELHQACYFLEAQSSFGGTILVWGAQAVIWGGTAPECPPVAPILPQGHSIHNFSLSNIGRSLKCILTKFELFKSAHFQNNTIQN